jgi:hypothetical protein
MGLEKRHVRLSCRPLNRLGARGLDSCDGSASHPFSCDGLLKDVLIERAELRKQRFLRLGGLNHTERLARSIISKFVW